MRNDDQRKALACGRQGIAQGLAGNEEGLRRIGSGAAGHGALICHALFPARRNDRGIPDLDGQRAVVERRLAGILVVVKDVHLAGIDEFERTHTDRPPAAGSQLRRIASGRDAERGRRGRLGQNVGTAEKEGARARGARDGTAFLHGARGEARLQSAPC